MSEVQPPPEDAPPTVIFPQVTLPLPSVCKACAPVQLVTPVTRSDPPDKEEALKVEAEIFVEVIEPPVALVKPSKEAIRLVEVALVRVVTPRLVIPETFKLVEVTEPSITAPVAFKLVVVAFVMVILVPFAVVKERPARFVAPVIFKLVEVTLPRVTEPEATKLVPVAEVKVKRLVLRLVVVTLLTVTSLRLIVPETFKLVVVAFVMKALVEVRLVKTPVLAVV